MSNCHHLASATDNEHLITRAFAAYYKAAARAGYLHSIPGNDSHLCELDGRRYVVLNSGNGILAVYRVRNDGILKELKRWPAELEKESAAGPGAPHEAETWALEGERPVQDWEEVATIGANWGDLADVVSTGGDGPYPVKVLRGSDGTILSVKVDLRDDRTGT